MYDDQMAKAVFRFIDEGTKNNINVFLNISILNESKKFTDVEEAREFFGEYNTEFHKQLNLDDLDKMQSYTGYSFKFINAAARGNWNYEDHGPYREDTVKEYKEAAEKLEGTLYKYPPLDFDFITYRGVNMNVFAKYGVNSITDLVKLKDQFLYEGGFTSTSILQSSSFFNRKLDNGINYNVLLRYHIPKEYSVGAFLSSDLTSCAPMQNEFLINKDTLGKVSNVQIDESTQTAILDVEIVPTLIWEPNRVQHLEQMKNK